MGRVTGGNGFLKETEKKVDGGKDVRLLLFNVSRYFVRSGLLALSGEVLNSMTVLQQEKKEKGNWKRELELS